MFETAEWLHAPWFQNEYRYAILDQDGGPSAATVFKLVSNAAEYDAHNLRDLFSLVPPVFPEQEALTESRVAATERVPLAPSNWFPNALVMFPGYVSAVLTATRDDLGAKELLVRGLVRWAEENGLRAIALPYADPADVTLGSALKAAGFVRSTMTRRTQLTVPRGDTFAAYFGCVSRQRGKRIQREMKEIRESGLITRMEPLDNRTLPDVLSLRIGLIEKHGHNVNVTKERTRLEWLTRFGDKLFLCCARRDGRLVGFTLFLEEGESWIAYMTGADASPAGAFVYFDTTFYVPLEFLYASHRNIREIDFGIGHAEAKVLRGAVGRPLDGWLLPIDPSLRAWSREAYPCG